MNDTGEATCEATCGWCLTEQARATVYGVASCAVCAASTRRERVTAWLRAVRARMDKR